VLIFLETFRVLHDLFKFALAAVFFPNIVRRAVSVVYLLFTAHVTLIFFRVHLRVKVLFCGYISQAPFSVSLRSGRP